MKSEEYFFDNLRQLTDVVKKAKKTKESESLPLWKYTIIFRFKKISLVVKTDTSAIVPYLVLFMRKLWFNVIPGKDLTADLTFHFPQVCDLSDMTH